SKSTILATCGGDRSKRPSRRIHIGSVGIDSCSARDSTAVTFLDSRSRNQFERGRNRHTGVRPAKLKKPAWRSANGGDVVPARQRGLAWKEFLSIAANRSWF